MLQNQDRDKVFGKSLNRLEDPSLLRGVCGFIDDIPADQPLHAVFVRSPLAHALVKGINKNEAGDQDGVFGIYTLADILPHCVNGKMPPPPGSPLVENVPEQFVLANDEVCHVG